MTPTENRRWVRLRWLARDAFAHAAGHHIATHGGTAKPEDLARIARAALDAAEAFETAAKAKHAEGKDDPE